MFGLSFVGDASPAGCAEGLVYSVQGSPTCRASGHALEEVMVVGGEVGDCGGGDSAAPRRRRRNAVATLHRAQHAPVRLETRRRDVFLQRFRLRVLALEDFYAGEVLVEAVRARVEQLRQRHLLRVDAIRLDPHDLDLRSESRRQEWR